MSQKLLIDGSRDSQTQVALLSENGLQDFEFESTSKKNLKGTIYLGKVSRIEASLRAAFIDIGSDKNGFLAFGEIHPNYFQIPVADREALIEAEANIEEEHNTENEIKEIEEGKEGENDESSASSENDQDDSSSSDEKVIKNRKNKSSANLKRRLYRSYKIQEVIKTGQ